MKTPRYVIGIYGADMWYVTDVVADKLVKNSSGTRDHAQMVADFMNEAERRSGAQELRSALETAKRFIEAYVRELGPLPSSASVASPVLDEIRKALAATGGGGE